MNEAETRAELIDPRLRACGWGVVEGSRVLREHPITQGRIQTGGRGKREIADYILVYKGVKLAVIEAKKASLAVGEGVMQAKKYADKLGLTITYSTNGREIYQICMVSGEEGLVDNFPTPQELWERVFPNTYFTEEDTGKDAKYQDSAKWFERFASIPFEDKGGTWTLRYYQEIAIQRTVEAIARGKNRILLTLATGTGKTAIAFQIAWKLFYTRWNLNRDGSRRPRILFLADRNILADQAFNSFSAFSDDVLVRIKPDEVRKKGRVPTNGSIFFTIFQTFMSGDSASSPTTLYAPETESIKGTPYFGEYPPDYFDFIVIDECHRGGANDESNWRDILDYFSPAVQLGLTATPKRLDNINTYRYFGEPVYTYSLKEGINDGFLTPFRVKRIKTTLDDYIFTTDDTVIEGEVEVGKLYEEKHFNRTIEIVEREAQRVNIFLDDCNQKEKGIIFCAVQEHAALIRDLVNQYAKIKDPFYCVRVTANDGAEGEKSLREFQDNEKTIPTILTTSQKLSTGVDARNIRNIVLLRPVNSMVEFKQIIGRGTRLFDGKEYFTIYDFVNAYLHFSDPEWDGEPIDEAPCSICGETPCVCVVSPPAPCPICGQRPCICEKEPPKPCEKCGEVPCVCVKKVKVKLGRTKARQLKHITSTSFWSADGKPISAEEFLANLFGELPKLFKDEDELRTIWSNPLTRSTLLRELEDLGFPVGNLKILQEMVDMENNDLYDVLAYVFNGDFIPKTRSERATAAEASVFTLLNEKQREFIAFVLSNYIKTGVSELGQEKLPILLKNKYQSLEDAIDILGEVEDIKSLFIGFQEHLYRFTVA